jgi:hypothetical protein
MLALLQQGNMLRNYSACVRFEVFTAVNMKNGVSGMLRRVALVRTHVSEELSASFIRVRICELGTTLAVTITGRTHASVDSYR